MLKHHDHETYKAKTIKRLVQILSVIVLLVVVSALIELSSLFIATAFIPLLIACVDCYFSRFAHNVSVELSTNQNMALYRWQPIKLRLKNKAKQVLRADISIHLTNALELAEAVKSIELETNQQAELSYSMRAHKRGDADISAVELRITSAFGLWQSNWLATHKTQLKVYPDFSRVTSKQHLNGVTNKPINGLKLTKKRGDGIEFHQLKYRQGDSVRQID